jgi:predicted ATPase/transcriptional regulator with XRE-family HTH domain
MERDIWAEVSFGEWLKRRRNGLGLTQEQLALQISCSTSALRKFEAEERRPSAQIIEQLAEVFGILPDERTSFLRFARGDWEAAPVGIIKDAPWRVSSEFPRSNLPASLTSLIGRERELARLGEYLSDPGTRLVTLIGPPGIGKTRLSLEVAKQAIHDFANGVFFVALAPLDDSRLVALTIVQALGFVEMKSRSPIERLKDGIGDKQMLLVLDNVEHLIEGTAPLVSDLLVACSRLKILTTSREALRVPGEWLYPVPALNIPAAIQLQSMDMEGLSQFAALTLFAERARAVRPDFALNTDNIQATASICAQLDGLPLAIELIAARIRWMSPQALLERLSGQFTLYADGMRAVSARQKTLHNAIAWSYNQLSVEEQKLFARLSVFAGGFTLDAAESIFSGTVTAKTVTDLIASLSDKSLLQRSFDARGESRFNMLVTIQQFALDRLHRMGEEAEIRNWHLTYFLELAEHSYREIHGSDQFKWLDRLEVEHNNLRTAWDYAIESNAELALRLASALLDFWLMRGNPSEGREWSAKLVRRTNEWGQTARRARVLGVAGWLALFQQDFAAARLLLEEALAIARVSGDKKEIAFALLWLGRTAQQQSDNQTAQAFIEECLMIYQGLQDQSGIAMAMLYLGCMPTNYAEAEEPLLKSLAKFRELGDKFWVAYGLNLLGELLRIQGDYERAGKFYAESIEILREQRSRVSLALSLFNLAWVSVHGGDHRKAKALFEESLKLGIEDGNRNVMTDCLAGFAAVLGIIGKPEQAARLFGAVEALLEGVGIRRRMDTSDQKEFDHYVAAVRTQLDEAAFAKAWAEGRAMTMEQAVAYALENQGG